MSALGVGAAFLGLFTGPSLASINLQIAQARTVAASSFTFVLSNTSRRSSEFPGMSETTESGTWQAPDHLQAIAVDRNGDGSSVIVVDGATFSESSRPGTHDSSASNNVVKIHFKNAPPLTPYAPNLEPLFGIPPLGVVSQATNVVCDGNTYIFEAPVVDQSFGWVAYAPLSRSTSGVTLETNRTAHDVLMKAVVKDGDIVSLSYPDGLPGSNGPVVWTLSHFGSSSLIATPSAR
jgi:hypothetical protein